MDRRQAVDRVLVIAGIGRVRLGDAVSVSGDDDNVVNRRLRHIGAVDALDKHGVVLARHRCMKDGAVDLAVSAGAVVARDREAADRGINGRHDEQPIVHRGEVAGCRRRTGRRTAVTAALV